MYMTYIIINYYEYQKQLIDIIRYLTKGINLNSSLNERIRNEFNDVQLEVGPRPTCTHVSEIHQIRE